MREAKYWLAMGAAAAVCAGLLALGESAAYLTRRTGLTNTFEFAPWAEIDISLTEPAWDPANAEKIVPGCSVPKDPQLTNTSTGDLDELAAIRIEFVYGENAPDGSRRGKTLSAEDMSLVCQVIAPDYEADTGEDSAWSRFEDENGLMPVQHFYYKRILRRNYPDDGDTTIPLFTRLTAGTEPGNELYEQLRGIGGFSIRIEGAALETSGSDPGDTSLTDPGRASREGLFVFPSEA